ncbi:uncharacterized protein [Halyomorpha halys]|uniref:uncharacterized protein n=1 Tax=Halyomorpha halys TaxID=286706 RepID=UPI0006D4D007|nr:nuclear factor NF-kappa-B p105 subunit [Halyomorpha halys]
MAACSSNNDNDFIPNNNYDLPINNNAEVPAGNDSDLPASTADIDLPIIRNYNLPKRNNYDLPKNNNYDLPKNNDNRLPTNNKREDPIKIITTNLRRVLNIDVTSNEAMEVTEGEGIGRTAEHLISLLTLRTKNAVVRVAGASVYRLDITLRELTTAQAFLLALFDALLAQDLHTCSLLLYLAASVEQLRSPYLEVWLREDFNFQKEEVRKVLIALDNMGLNVPGYIFIIFAGLTKKYGSCKKPEDIFDDDIADQLYLEELNVSGHSLRMFTGLTDKNGSSKKTVDEYKNTNVNYNVDDDLCLEAIPDLVVPTHELAAAKRCLGLPPNISSTEVMFHACKPDVEGYTLLHRFAEAGHNQGVEELLSIGVPCDLRGPGGSLPLHYAAEYGQLQVLPLLLNAGSNISAARDDGNTAAHLAASMGNVETLSWLAEHGAKITAKNFKGQTPLHVAAAGGHAAMLTFLLDLMADRRRSEGTRLGAIPRGVGEVDPLDSDSCTPLHLAARANNLDAVRILLDRGANYNVFNDEGLTPLNEAMLWGATETEQLLNEIRESDKKKNLG